MTGPPGLEAAPAEAVVTLGTSHTAEGQGEPLSPDSAHSQGLCHPVTDTAANKTVYSLQAPLILLYLSLAVWAVL